MDLETYRALVAERSALAKKQEKLREAFDHKSVAIAEVNKIITEKTAKRTVYANDCEQLQAEIFSVIAEMLEIEKQIEEERG